MPMPRHEAIDPDFPIAKQIQSDEAGSVVLLNTFTVAAEDVEAMLATWRTDSAIMKRQPGFISAQLHRGVGGANVFVNYAVWESLDAFRSAFANPEFRAAIANSPASAVARPVLLKKMAVPGICVE